MGTKVEKYVSEINLSPEMRELGDKIAYSQKMLNEASVEIENEFFTKIANQCLGRDFDPKIDLGRFSFNHHPSIILGEARKMLVFDGVEVGEVKTSHIRFKWEFIPWESAPVKENTVSDNEI